MSWPACSYNYTISVLYTSCPRPFLRCMKAEEVVLQGLTYGLTSSLLEVRDAGRRKGRGVFATARIQKGEFLCEYRTNRVYHPKHRAKYEREYELNDEGSYLLETQYGRKLVFDATRSFHQLGRYINHSSTHHNCRYWRPLFVRGKWRVGFLATRDIDDGEELCYDYGVRGLTWMLAESPKKPAARPRKFSLEHYRRRRFCPVPGCSVTKPLKKLSNHLTYRHPGLSKQDRADFLAKAKIAGLHHTTAPVQTPSPTQASLSSYFQPVSSSTLHHAEPQVDTPARRKGRVGRKGKAPTVEGRARSDQAEQQTGSSDTPTTSHRARSTRHYPSFEVSKSPFLMSLLDYAKERFGLGMAPSVAAEFLSDVSKYLYFAGQGEESSHNLYDVDKVKSYLIRLEKDGISCSGQLTKLHRIETALRFAKTHNKWPTSTVSETMPTLTLWKKRLQREKTATAKKKLPRISEDLEQLGNYTDILTMPEPLARVKRALSGPDPPEPTEFNTAMAYIALHFFLRCTQRKSVVENLTVEEYTAATEEGDGHWIITVSRHKTAQSRGPAHLVMDRRLKLLCDRYLVFRKGLGSSPNLLVNHRGHPPTSLPQLVRDFASQYHVRFPTPTQHRKAVGTAACKLPQKDQERVAAFMSHSLQTQQRYYRALESRKDSLEAYTIVNRELLSPQATPTVKKRLFFTKPQENRIRDYFKTSIDSQQKISPREAADFLGAFPMEGRSPKHIQDKVRTIIRQRQQGISES